MGLVLANHAHRSGESDYRSDPAAAKRAFDALVQAKYIDIAALEAAHRS
jgi:hypothetical protein